MNAFSGYLLFVSMLEILQKSGIPVFGLSATQARY